MFVFDRINRIHIAPLSPIDYKSRVLKLATILEKEFEERDLTISLDRLITSLNQADIRRKAGEGFNDTPPKIIVSNAPAVLVSIDGQPKMQKLEGSDLEYVVNTPFVIMKQSNNKTLYLYAGSDAWYRADNSAFSPTGLA